MKTPEQKLAEKLAKVSAELTVARRKIRTAKRLLERSLDALPDYMDGRNDKLVAAIENFLE